MGQGNIYIESTEGHGWYEFIAKRNGEFVTIGAGDTVEEARKDLVAKLAEKVTEREQAIQDYEERLQDLPHLIVQERQDKQALEDALRDLQSKEAQDV